MGEAAIAFLAQAAYIGVMLYGAYAAFVYKDWWTAGIILMALALFQLALTALTASLYVAWVERLAKKDGPSDRR